MTDFPHHLPLSDFRAVWVYRANMTDDEAHALLDDAVQADGDVPKPLPNALGLDALDTDFIDFMFDPELLAFPLSRMLVEGHGMDAASVLPDAEKLDSIRGQVLLVHSRALGADAPSENPMAPLTFVGRYREKLEFGATDMAPASLDAPLDAVAKPRKTPSDSAMGGRVATIALLVMAALVWLMIKVAG